MEGYNQMDIKGATREYLTEFQWATWGQKKLFTFLERSKISTPAIGEDHQLVLTELPGGKEASTVNP